MTDKLPGARAALVDKAGITTPPFYRYFQALERLLAGTASAADIAAINAQISAIQAEIAALPKASFPTLQVSAPLTSAGLLQNGFARLGWKGTTSDVPEGTNLYYTDARVDARLSQGYIDGLQIQWVSGTAVTVSSGTAYVPGLGKYLQSNTAIALSGLALTASTWYHLYLYSNAGTPTVECVTTAPVLYYGTAYQKTGDNTRRYIGSVLADSSGNIRQFKVSGSRVVYLAPMDDPAKGSRVLANGAATTATSISLAGIIPVTATHAQLRALSNGSAASRWSNQDIAGASTDSGGGSFYIMSLSPGAQAVLDFPVASNRTILYWLVSAGSGIYCDVMGYLFQR